MKSSDVAFTGTMPEVYDRCLARVSFAPYAEEIGDRIAALAPRRILETAAGTGILTRALAARLPRAEIVATDLNQAMIDYAAGTLEREQISWILADALSLPFPDASFDAVVNQFGVMFFPDKPKAFLEARRVLRRGGTLLFAVWDRMETSEPGSVLTAALTALFPEDPPDFLSRATRNYHDVKVIEDDLRRAGFEIVKIEKVPKRGWVTSPRDVASGYCEGTPLRHELAARGSDTLAKAKEAVARAFGARFGEGPFEVTHQAIVVTAQ